MCVNTSRTTVPSAVQESVAQFRIEWPTVGVAAAMAGGFVAVLGWHERLPIAATLVALAVLGGWYNSLQHEVIHEHPTPWRRLNTALAIIPLGLVVRFPDYRDSHLAHHRTPELTNPGLDPESFYVPAETWHQWSAPRRAVHHVTRTLLGRLVFGPFVLAARHWRHGFGWSGSRASVRRVVGHAVGVIAVLLVVRSSGLPIWVYVLGVSWGGSALSLLRSFAEHRYVDGGTRSAVVRSGWFFSLLYLNNNLHHSHHAKPWVPWFDLPVAHAALDGDRAAVDGAGWYRGYGEIVRRYLVVPIDRPTAGPVLLPDDDAADPPAWTAAAPNALPS
jgi:fatty acid desaturase